MVRQPPAAGAAGSSARHTAHPGTASPSVLAAEAALREEVWSAMRAAKVARFPGAAGRLRGLPAWQGTDTVKANPDSAQLPVRQRALEDGKT
jgi:5-formyltetrahydrofolate cyclo-ligase